MSAHGYHPLGCWNPSEAYNRLYADTYDIIISDIMMPEINGFEFAEAVRATDKNIPILFMTARDDLDSKQKGYRLGIDDYMVSPLTWMN